MEKIIIQGRIINADGEDYAQIEIDTRSGLIERIAEHIGTPTIALKTKMIFPGFIDLHVHAREDISGKQMHKETFLTASEAAINGGVALFMDMPNNTVAPIDEDSYLAKEELAGSARIPIILYAGIGPHTRPLGIQSRNIPYKTFMGPSVGDLFFENQEGLETAIRKYEGQSVSFHCEDPALLERHKDEETHEKKRPKQSEITAISTALALIGRYDLAGKICHVSTAEGIQLIKAAKRSGINVTCEATPHHLYFDETMLTEENRKWLQMNPPLRTSDDKITLQENLRAGHIDYIATDHAPHTIEEKQEGTSGVPHLDTYGAFTTWLMKERGFNPQEIARVCSYNQGKFLQQFTHEKYGKIAEGYTGSLTIIDMDTPTRVTKETLKTKCRWSPFEGITFPGRVAYTIVKGKIFRN